MDEQMERDSAYEAYYQTQLEQQESEEGLAYCDKIAATIKQALNSFDPDGIIAGCGPVKLDLHPEYGYLISSAKTMFCADMGGKLYRIRVEEV